ncbi:MAG: DUF58 domain-containing protein [Deltaproteobacteria bacterium]|nr:MAG: DUF58 domain-containing protein [Deltaproteobacteria bacterium]
MLASEIIRRVREIQIRTGRPVADVLAGEYVSVFKGGGIEFEEVRPYVVGDDVRTIDWNVTARTGEPYVKRYVEERQLTLMLMADVSASQDFGSGSRSKREAAAELCALLAFSAIRNDDKVGLILFHDQVEQYIPARKGQRHALRVIREVLAHGEDAAAAPSERGTDIATAVEFLLGVTKRRSVCFVVSDFLDEGFERALQTANARHDVIAVLITDPRELEFPSVGLIELRDAETGAVRLYDTGSPAFRATVAEAARARIEQLEARLRKAGIDFIHIDASGSVVDPLVRFFRMRERRIRR